MSAGQLLNTFEDIKAYLDSLVKGEYLLKSETNFSAPQGRNQLLTQAERSKLLDLPVITQAQVYQFVEAYDRGDWNAAIVTDHETNDDTKIASASAVYNLRGMVDSINALIASDDTNLDELQEIVDFIKNNKTDLESLGINNIAGLQAALDTKLDEAAANAEFARLDGTNMPFTADVEAPNFKLTTWGGWIGVHDTLAYLKLGTQESEMRLYGSYTINMNSNGYLGRNFRIQNNDVDLFRIDADAFAHKIEGSLDVGRPASGTALLTLTNDAGTGRLRLNGADQFELFNELNDDLLFGTNNSERARITASGHFLVNSTVDSGEQFKVIGASKLQGAVEVIGEAIFRAPLTKFYGTGAQSDRRLTINETTSGLAQLYNYDEGDADFYDIEIGGTSTSGTGLMVTDQGSATVNGTLTIQDEFAAYLVLKDGNGTTFQLNSGGAGGGIFSLRNSDTDTDLLRVNQTGEVEILSGGSASKPALGFGDGDTGFYLVSDDAIGISTDGANRFFINANGISSNSTPGAFISRLGASATLPVFSFVSDNDTGIGRSGDDGLSLIAGGNEIMRLNGSNATDLKVDVRANLRIGPTASEYLLTAATHNFFDSNNGAFYIRNQAAGQPIRFEVDGSTRRLDISANGVYATGNLVVGNTTSLDYISIDHPGGSQTKYLEFKNGSDGLHSFRAQYGVGGNFLLRDDLNSKNIWEVNPDSTFKIHQQTTIDADLIMNGVITFTPTESSGTMSIEDGTPYGLPNWTTINTRGDALAISNDGFIYQNFVNNKIQVRTALDFLDDHYLSFGNDQKYRLKYDLTNDRLVLSGGGNNFLEVKEQGAGADFDFFGSLSVNGSIQINSNLTTDGYLSIGSGSSDTNLRFWDNNATGYKEIKWDQGQDAFRLQDDAGVFHNIVHAGNIDAYTSNDFVSASNGGAFNNNISVQGLVHVEHEANNFAYTVNHQGSWGGFRIAGGSNEIFALQGGPGISSYQLSTEINQTAYVFKDVYGHEFDGNATITKQNAVSFTVHPSNTQHQHQLTSNAGQNLTVYSQTSQAYMGYMITSISNDDQFNIGSTGIKKGVSFGSFTDGQNVNIGNFRTAHGGGVRYYASSNGANTDHTWYGNGVEIMRLKTAGELITGDTTIVNHLNLKQQPDNADPVVAFKTSSDSVIGTITYQEGGDAFFTGEDLSNFIFQDANVMIEEELWMGSTGPWYRFYKSGDDFIFTETNGGEIFKHINSSGRLEFNSNLDVPNLDVSGTISVAGLANFTQNVQVNNNLTADGYLSIGSGSSDTNLRFWDNNATGYKEIKWDNSQNAFRLQDGAGLFHTIVHSGNISQYSGSVPTLQNVVEAGPTVTAIDTDSTFQILRNFDNAALGLLMTDTAGANTFVHNTNDGSTQTWGYWRQWNDSDYWDILVDGNGKLRIDQNGNQRGLWSSGELNITSSLWASTLRATSTANNTVAFFLGESWNNPRIRYKSYGYEFLDATNSWESIYADAIYANHDLHTLGSTDIAGAHIRDINFENQAETAGDKRQVILRATADYGTTGTRGGRFQLYTRNQNDGNYTVGLGLTSSEAIINVPLRVNSDFRVHSNDFMTSSVQDFYFSNLEDDGAFVFRLKDTGGTNRNVMSLDYAGSQITSDLTLAQNLIMTDSQAISLGNVAGRYRLQTDGNRIIALNTGNALSRVRGGDAIETDEFVTKSQLDAVTGSQNLQQVTDEGAVTTNEITVDTLNVSDSGTTAQFRGYQLNLNANKTISNSQVIFNDSNGTTYWLGSGIKTNGALSISSGANATELLRMSDAEAQFFTELLVNVPTGASNTSRFAGRVSIGNVSNSDYGLTVNSLGSGAALFNGDTRVNGGLTLADTFVGLVFDETDQTGANGLWRIEATGDTFQIARNLSTNRDFTNRTFPMSIDSTNKVKLTGSLELSGQSSVIDLASPNHASWGAFEKGALHASIDDNTSASWLLTANQENPADNWYGIQVLNANGPTMRIYSGSDFLKLNDAGVHYNSDKLATEAFVIGQNYMTSADLSAYATQAWVTAQGFAPDSGNATQAWVSSNYASLGGNLGQNFGANILRLQNSETGDLTTVGQIGYDTNDSSAPALLGAFNDTHPIGLYVHDGTDIRRIWTTDHFTGTHVANWQTAFGWGDHTGLYLPVSGGAISGNISLGTAGLGGTANRRLNIQSDSDSVAIALAENSGGEAFGLGVNADGSFVLHNSSAGTIHTTFHDNGSTLFNGDVLIEQGSKLLVEDSTNLGSTAGDSHTQIELAKETNNTDRLIVSNTRISSGADWITAGYRLQQKVDSTWMGYMQFNGNNNGGISFGAGLTVASATAVPEVFKIHTSGITSYGTTSLQSGATISGSDLGISGSGRGINLSGGNNRIYFSGYRGLEGTSDGSNLQVGEGYSNIYLQGHAIVESTLQVASTAYLNGEVRMGNNVWHTSEEGSERLYFANASHTYIKSVDRVIFRTNNTNTNGAFVDGNSFYSEFNSGTSWGTYQNGNFHSHLDDNVNATWLLTADQKDAGDVKYGIQVLNTGEETRLYSGSNYFKFVGGNFISQGYLSAGGDIYANGTHIWGDNKVAITYNDGFLRLNNSQDFASGVYTPGPLRADGGLRIDGNNRGIRNITGAYGTVQTTGSGAGSWEGFSIDGRVVFMHDGSSGYGIYDDTNDHWGLYAVQNGYTQLRHAGNAKLQTTSSGVQITGDITGVTDLYVNDQIISVGDSNTYMQFHAEDQWRVVTGGAERLEVNNSITTVSNSLRATKSLYTGNGGSGGSGAGIIHFGPGGASYSTGTSSVTGAIEVTLPGGFSSRMLRMTIKVYEYSSGESFTVECGGYPYGTSNSWANTFATIIGGETHREFNVRFANVNGSPTIFIGETSSTWSYPQVFVTDVQVGFSSSTSYDNYNDGWSIGFETSSYGTVNSTISATLPASDWNKLANKPGTVWHSGNDGAGSGLDADLLDGVQGSSYARTDIAEVFGSNITVNGSVNSSRFGLLNDCEMAVSDSNPVWNGVTYGGTFTFTGDSSTAASLLYAGGLQLSRDLQVRNIYSENSIYHAGNIGTYLQFHNTDQWRVVTANVERLEISNTEIWFDETVGVNAPRGIHGGYGAVNSTGTGVTWGGTIYSIGPAYDGTSAGNSWAPTTLYGAAWIRSGNANAHADIGEGLYIYQAGNLKGGLGSTGLYVDGAISATSYSGNGAGLTNVNAASVGGASVSTIFRYLSIVTDADLDNLSDNGFRRVNYSGSSSALVSYNTGGSTGTVQQEYLYNTASRGYRVRNKTDNNTWSAWGYVVMATTNQGHINGTVLHTGNYTSYVVPKTGGTFSGTITATNFIKASDSRLKEGMEGNVLSLETLKKIEPKLYKVKATGEVQAGVYADQLPEEVAFMTEPIEGDFIGMKYDNLHALSIAAIQEVDEENRSLRKEVNALRDEVEELKSMIQKLI